MWASVGATGGLASLCWLALCSSGPLFLSGMLDTTRHRMYPAKDPDSASGEAACAWCSTATGALRSGPAERARVEHLPARGQTPVREAVSLQGLLISPCKRGLAGKMSLLSAGLLGWEQGVWAISQATRGYRHKFTRGESCDASALSLSSSWSVTKVLTFPRTCCPCSGR